MSERKLFVAGEEHAGLRLDQFLVKQIAEVSRARVQQLIRAKTVRVNGKNERASLKLAAGDQIEVLGEAKAPPLRATAEDIPLEIVYEDSALAVINKPAGMIVHAGAGTHDEARNRGTLVNALLHHFKKLSAVSGELRPGIVHRLDKQTSGLIIVAKTDAAHRTLAKQFSEREVKKTYVALVHGWPKQASGTISAPISRDRLRRTRMTTRGREGRDAVSHYKIIERFETPWGKFALLEVRIETGRTHQIRVHLASAGHPVGGDALYGAPRELRPVAREKALRAAPRLERNFLHAARLEFRHPVRGNALRFEAPLPHELENFVSELREPAQQRT
jgi:23S rRNA pseudouridine1911/1915/1917 synthase